MSGVWQPVVRGKKGSVQGVWQPVVRGKKGSVQGVWNPLCGARKSTRVYRLYSTDEHTRAHAGLVRERPFCSLVAGGVVLHRIAGGAGAAGPYSSQAGHERCSE